MTEKLYYIDSHMKTFTAAVTSCEKDGERYLVTLDRTAFFPEGGGQPGDSGMIGDVRVFDTHEKNGEILHYVNREIEPGRTYDCAIDWETRFRRMQNHSGEHIVSGLVHKKYGYNNVGFHMGSDVVTIDFDGELSWEQLSEIERDANYAVAANYKVTATFPPEEVLKTLEYRSKLELTENVRIVEIENTDICACCAPHVSSTAEVGTVRILTSERRRRGGEGVRITMLCGLDAYDNEVVVSENNTEISMLLSAKRNETAAAVRRLMGENEKLKTRSTELCRELARQRAGSIEPTEGNICLFDSILDEPALRALVNEAVKKCSGIAAVFSGSDEGGYRYIIGSRTADLRKAAKSINEGISGRGGGSPEMIQGSSPFRSAAMPKYGIPPIYMIDTCTGLNLREYLGEAIYQQLSAEAEKNGTPLDREKNGYMGGLLLALAELKKRMAAQAASGAPKQKREDGCYPPAIALGCTWNPKIAELCGKTVAREIGSHGIDMILGPCINIHRDPLAGRLSESYSEDPKLLGEIAAGMVRGIQSTGLLADVKHFAANSQEKDRLGVNERVSERALREIYLKGFEIAVKEGHAYSIMSTYGPINGIWTAGRRRFYRFYPHHR